MLGVVVGVPVGLWLNRRGEASAGKAKRDEIAHVLDILRTAIEDNRTRLERFGQALAQGNSLYDTGLDASTWEALQTALTSDFREPELRRRLATFFSRTGAVVKLNDLFVRFAVGVEGATVNAPKVRQQLLTTLQKAVDVLLEEANGLVEAIPDARARLLSGR